MPSPQHGKASLGRSMSTSRSSTPASDSDEDDGGYFYPYWTANAECKSLLKQVAGAKRPPRVDRDAEGLACMADEAGFARGGSCTMLIAKSTYAAVELLRLTLPEETLPCRFWDRLLDRAWGNPDQTSFAGPHPPMRAPPELGRHSSLDEEEERAAKRQRRVLHGEFQALLGEAPRPTASAEDVQTRDKTPLGRIDDENDDDEGVASEKDGLPGAAAVRHTTTDRNKTLMSRMRKKAERKFQGRRKEMGLIAPRPDATAKEHSAYALVTPADEADVSWLFKQPVGRYHDLYTSTSAPYTEATTLLQKARAVGDASVQASTAAFLRNWRVNGSPFNFGEPDTDRSNASGGRLQGRRSVLSLAWRTCERAEQELEAMHVKYRWAMAFLGKEYHATVERMRDMPRNDRSGARVKTLAIDELLELMGYDCGADPPEDARRRFRRRITKAGFWYAAVDKLGWGILCLMPSHVIHNSWVEKMRVKNWNVWLDLVERVNPLAVETSREFEAWLGPHGLEGSAIAENEMLAVEEPTVAPSQLEDVEESEESDAEEAGANHEIGRMGFTLSQRAPQAVPRSVLPLFKPSSR